MTHSFGRRGRSIDSGLLLYSGGRSRITVLMGLGLLVSLLVSDSLAERRDFEVQGGRAINQLYGVVDADVAAKSSM